MSQPVYPCPRCGGDVSLDGLLDLQSMSASITGKCAGCGAKFREIEFDEIQTNATLGKVPSVDALRAARMLGRPADGTWAANELRGSGAPSDKGIIMYPLSAILAYADSKSIQITPLDENSPAFWMDK